MHPALLSLLLAATAQAHEPPEGAPQVGPSATLDPAQRLATTPLARPPEGMGMLGPQVGPAPDWQIAAARPAGIAMPMGWHRVPSWGATRLHLAGNGVGLPEVDEHGEALEIGILVESTPGRGSLERHSRRFARRAARASSEREILRHEVAEVTICGDKPAALHRLEIRQAGRASAFQRLMVLDDEGQAWSATAFVSAGQDSALTAADSPLVAFLEPWLLSFCPALERIDTSALDQAWAQERLDGP